MKSETFLLIVIGLIEVYLVYDYLSQDSTPTPSFVREIHRGLAGKNGRIIQYDVDGFYAEKLSLGLMSNTHALPRFPALFPLDVSRISAEQTESVITMTGDIGAGPEIKNVYACWRVPRDYRTGRNYSNPFVYEMGVGTPAARGRVLFYNNRTHVLGVPANLCTTLTGIQSASIFWDSVRGDFIGCYNKHGVRFLGVFCKIGTAAIADVCPLVSHLVDNACLAVSTLV